MNIRDIAPEVVVASLESAGSAGMANLAKDDVGAKIGGANSGHHAAGTGTNNKNFGM